MTKAISCLLLVIQIFLFSHNVSASDFSAEERRQRHILSKLLKKDNCHGGWVALWRWSKADHKWARRMLGLGIFANINTLPGGHADYFKRLRYAMTLLTYGLQSNEDSKFYAGIVSTLTFPGSENNTHPFRECLAQSARLHECANIGVSKRMIPSFKEIEAELDSLLAAGARVQCTGVEVR